jgi:hypothetical protein
MKCPWAEIKKPAAWENTFFSMLDELENSDSLYVKVRFPKKVIAETFKTDSSTFSGYIGELQSEGTIFAVTRKNSSYLVPPGNDNLTLDALKKEYQLLLPALIQGVYDQRSDEGL